MISKITKKERCLFIGGGDVIRKIMLEERFCSKYRPVFFDTHKHKRTLTEVVQTFGIKTVVLDTNSLDSFGTKIMQDFVYLRLVGVLVYYSYDFYEFITQRISIIKLQGNKYLGDRLFSVKIRKRYLLGKRIFDLFMVFCLAPFALLLIGLGVLGTFLTSKGGVFFIQERVGRRGKVFKIYKIRTMRVNDGNAFTTLNDTRITPFGKFLRLTKIDELPQLYNVLKGDMSIFGPRPEILTYVEKSFAENPYYSLRHIIKPGISGWAQIHIPKANPNDNLKKLEYDLFYIKNYSLMLDLKIFIKTIKIVFTLDSK